MTLWLLRLVVLALVLSTISAAPASPHGSSYVQPDETKTPELFLNGNEHYSWKTDSNGYTVIQDEHDWYVYARKVDGELVSSKIRVGYGNPKKLGLVPGLNTDPDKRPANGIVPMNQAARDHRELLNIPSSAMCSFEGTKKDPCRLKGLVVLIRFSDHRYFLFACVVLNLLQSLLNTPSVLLYHVDRSSFQVQKNMIFCSITMGRLRITPLQREVLLMSSWRTAMIRLCWTPQ